MMLLTRIATVSHKKYYYYSHILYVINKSHFCYFDSSSTTFFLDSYYNIFYLNQISIYQCILEQSLELIEGDRSILIIIKLFKYGMNLLLCDGGLDSFEHLSHLNNVEVMIRGFVILFV